MLEYLGVGIPSFIVNRSDLDKVNLAQFDRVTGIKKTRRWLESTEEMILSAIKGSKLMEQKSIEAVIVVTQTPDRLSPCMAVSVHKYLNLPHDVPVFDINHACDGFLFGVHVAQTLGRRTLVVCADRLRYDKTPMESLIFSDSVSLALVSPYSSFSTAFYTDGSGIKNLYCGLNGEMNMDGPTVFDFATTKIPEMILKFLKERNDMPVDWLVLHQANKSMMTLIESRTGFRGKSFSSIEEYGNQSMNSIPTALVVNESKALNRNLLLVGFGAGYTATAMRMTWPKHRISEIIPL